MHNLEFSVRNKRHSMFSVKEKPWHQLGLVVDKALTSAEAIEAANLDFEVEKIENYTRYGNKELTTTSFSTVRTDIPRVLGSVGKDYTVVQNKNAFKFFDDIVGEGKAIFETGGVLGKGEQIFITAKLPKTIVLKNVDEIEQYLLLSNSHDGSRSIEVLFTPIRVVCNNTLTAALQMAKNRVKIRHTASVEERLADAHKLLGIHTTLMEEQEQMFNLMAGKQLSVQEFKTYACNVFLTKPELAALAVAGLDKIESGIISTRKVNVIDKVAQYFEYGPGQAMTSARGTMWGAYNAVTGYFHNMKDFKEDTTKKMRTNFYGTNYTTMHTAYVKAKDMCEGSLELLPNTIGN